jgi:hypothetical protein
VRFGKGECSPDLHFILHCCQEGLTEVGNAKHLVGTAMADDQQRGQAKNSEMNHRTSVVELEPKVKIWSRYERVFRSLKTDGIFVKLSKMPDGAVGLS